MKLHHIIITDVINFTGESITVIIHNICITYNDIQVHTTIHNTYIHKYIIVSLLPHCHVGIYGNTVVSSISKTVDGLCHTVKLGQVECVGARS